MLGSLGDEEQESAQSKLGWSAMGSFRGAEEAAGAMG